jgi:FdrA protein
LLVSKPPAPEVARAVTAVAGDTPLIAALIGLQSALDDRPLDDRPLDDRPLDDRPLDDGPLDDGPLDVVDSVTFTATLEQGVVAALNAVGRSAPDPTIGLRASVSAGCDRLDESRTLIRGLFSGGTLCYEALSLLYQLVGAVYSNTPIDKHWGLPAPPEAHTCLDLGEEEYTKGRPHPMIDPEARIELMRQEGADPHVAVVLIDVVLGYGSHPDPAGLLAPVAREVMAAGAGPQVVAYVLGTDGDPQGLEDQRRQLRGAGCIVPATAARAALAAAALATRQPDLVLSLP